MTQYSVTLLYDACQTVNVEAEDPQEAIEKAQQQGGVILCHQCANDIELADVIAEIVYEGDKEVLDTTPYAEKGRAYKKLAEVEKQRDQLAVLLAKYSKRGLSPVLTEAELEEIDAALAAITGGGQ